MRRSFRALLVEPHEAARFALVCRLCVARGILIVTPAVTPERLLKRIKGAGK
jgi:hypothetical protein